jgi:hypothetical protein
MQDHELEGFVASPTLDTNRPSLHPLKTSLSSSTRTPKCPKQHKLPPLDLKIHSRYAAQPSNSLADESTHQPPQSSANPISSTLNKLCSHSTRLLLLSTDFAR